MSSLLEHHGDEDIVEIQSRVAHVPDHAAAMNPRIFGAAVLGAAGLIAAGAGCSRNEKSNVEAEVQKSRDRVKIPDAPKAPPEPTPEELHEHNIAGLQKAIEDHLTEIDAIRKNLQGHAPHHLAVDRQDQEESEQLWKSDLRKSQSALRRDRELLGWIYARVSTTNGGILVEIAQPKFGQEIVMRKFLGGQYRLADGTEGKLTPRPGNALGPTGEFSVGNGFYVFEIPVEHQSKRGTLTIRVESTGMTTKLIGVADPAKPMTIKTDACTVTHHGLREEDGGTKTGVPYSLSHPKDGPLALSLAGAIRQEAMGGDGKPLRDGGSINLHPTYIYSYRGDPQRVEYTVPDTLSSSQREYTLSMPSK